MASAQLQLIYTDHAWKLDRRTVEIGRAGVAQARAALAAATVLEGETTDHTDQDHHYDHGTHGTHGTRGTHRAAA